MKGASRWFHYTNALWCTVNKTLNLTYVRLQEDYIVQVAFYGMFSMLKLQ
jgi:hypothetical protein